MYSGSNSIPRAAVRFFMSSSPLHIPEYPPAGSPAPCRWPPVWRTAPPSPCWSSEPTDWRWSHPPAPTAGSATFSALRASRQDLQ